MQSIIYLETLTDSGNAIHILLERSVLYCLYAVYSFVPFGSHNQTVCSTEHSVICIKTGSLCPKTCLLFGSLKKLPDLRGYSVLNAQLL